MGESRELSLSLPVPLGGAMRPQWSQSPGSRLRGLCLAREKGTVLAWDDKSGVYLLNRAGARQAQARPPGTVVAGCAADDGSAYAAVGSKGEVWWFAPDLSTRWERNLANRAVAAAVDPFGQYIAVADAKATLHVLDRQGRPVCRVPTHRSLHHLAFVPAAPLLLGSADYGLVACFDLAGQQVWRDGLVAHVGSLAVSGDGEQIILACFTEGLVRYDLRGKLQERWTAGDPCRLAATAFNGSSTLVATLSNRLILLDGKGQPLAGHALDQAPVGLALAALADRAVIALAEGAVVALELREAPRA